MNRSDVKYLGSKYRFVEDYELLGVSQGEIVELIQDDGTDILLFLTKSGLELWLCIEVLEPVPALEDIKVGQRVEIVGNHHDEDPHYYSIGDIGTVVSINQARDEGRINVKTDYFLAQRVLPEDIKIIEEHKLSPEDIKVGQIVEVFGFLPSIAHNAEVLAIHTDGSIRVKHLNAMGIIQDLTNHLEGRPFSITAILEEPSRVNSYGVHWDDITPGFKVIDNVDDEGYIVEKLPDERIRCYWPALGEILNTHFEEIVQLHVSCPMKIEDVKIGQKVAVIGNSSGHNFGYGTVITVDNFFSDSEFISVGKDGQRWIVNPRDVELLEEAPEPQEEASPTPKVVKITGNSQPSHHLLINSLARVVNYEKGLGEFKVVGVSNEDSFLLPQVVSVDDVEVIV